LGVTPKLALNDGQKCFLSVIQKLCDKTSKIEVKNAPKRHKIIWEEYGSKKLKIIEISRYCGYYCLL